MRSIPWPRGIDRRVLVLRAVSDLVGPGGDATYGDAEAWRAATRGLRGGLVDLLEAALPDLLRDLEPGHRRRSVVQPSIQGSGHPARPRPSDRLGSWPPSTPSASPSAASPSDDLPAHVKRAVMARDGGRCQLELPSGERCGSTHRLEFDHVTPLARGGASTVDNVRLCCRAHNLIAARRAFGDAWMDRFAPGRSATPSRLASPAGPDAVVVLATSARAALP